MASTGSCLFSRQASPFTCKMTDNCVVKTVCQCSRSSSTLRLCFLPGPCPCFPANSWAPAPPRPNVSSALRLCREHKGLHCGAVSHASLAFHFPYNTVGGEKHVVISFMDEKTSPYSGSVVCLTSLSSLRRTYQRQVFLVSAHSGVASRR